MKNKTQFLMLLISISFFSCNSGVKKTASPISSIDTDFPVTEQLEFKPFNKCNILEVGGCIIDDSTLWFIHEGESDFGFCYDLNTGEKLSVIASKGRAANELTELGGFIIIGDSLQLLTGQNTIKTFDKKDIINNVPMGDRKFSVTVAPDSLLVRRMIKLPNGSVLATIQPTFLEVEKEDDKNEINRKSVVIFNDKEANSYETINYDNFDVEEAKGNELAANELIKCAYCDGIIGIKDNDMAVFSVSNQFILYTFDIKSGKVVNEKRYTEMQRTTGGSDSFVSYTTMNDRMLDILSMKNNDKYIVCQVGGYLTEGGKDSKLYKKEIFVFDWKLNPIKRFDLPQNEYYIISNDGKSVYFCKSNEDGLALYKADLNL